MNEPVLTHQICAGERWDSLAWRYYADIAEIPRLIHANPHLALCEVLPQGQILFVPILKVRQHNQADMPIWLQGDDDE